MMIQKVIDTINYQIKAEEESSRLYFAMANWCESKGFAGSAAYLYEHANEERMHMIKLVKYLNERGSFAQTLALEEPQNQWESIQDVFKGVLEHEEVVTSLINKLFEVCMEEKDYLSSNFLQWYIQEQVEEESSARAVLDKLELASTSQGGLFHFDKEMGEMAVQAAANLLTP
ncbi:MAG: ferritin [Bacteroidetes bacterium 4572_77]|nr:MAG: ferritin [Bacteroidetes bacterium 4572_77]